MHHTNIQTASVQNEIIAETDPHQCRLHIRQCMQAFSLDFRQTLLLCTQQCRHCLRLARPTQVKLLQRVQQLIGSSMSVHA